MFVLNQLLGTILVHPDWDTVLQWNIKYAMFGVGVAASIYFADVIIITKMFEGYAHG